MAIIVVEQRPLFFMHHPGPTSRPALLLIHGAGGRHLDWPTQLRHWPQTAVYTLDLPGHARSPGPGRDSVAGYADIVLGFIQALQLSPVILVGHSLGGAIVQALALRRPPQVVGLVLIGTSSRLRVGDAILHNILPHFNQAVALINKLSWSANARPVQVGLNKRLLAETSPEVLYGDFYACSQFNLMGQLGCIQVPTLVLSGAEDKMTPPKNGRLLANEIPQAQFALLDGAGHYMMQEQPHETARIIAAFVEHAFPVSYQGWGTQRI